jgi:hypothetical protein
MTISSIFIRASPPTGIRGTIEKSSTGPKIPAGRLRCREELLRNLRLSVVRCDEARGRTAMGSEGATGKGDRRRRSGRRTRRRFDCLRPAARHLQSSRTHVGLEGGANNARIERNERDLNKISRVRKKLEGGGAREREREREKSSVKPIAGLLIAFSLSFYKWFRTGICFTRVNRLFCQVGFLQFFSLRF